MDNKKIKVGNHSIKVADSNESNVSPEDKAMDKRVAAAVKSAINKANVCNKPIAKYDMRTKKAYVEQTNGEKKYVV
jgi:hypothetical protein